MSIIKTTLRNKFAWENFAEFILVFRQRNQSKDKLKKQVCLKIKLLNPHKMPFLFIQTAFNLQLTRFVEYLNFAFIFLIFFAKLHSKLPDIWKYEYRNVATDILS